MRTTKPKILTTWPFSTKSLQPPELEHVDPTLQGAPGHGEVRGRVLRKPRMAQTLRGGHDLCFKGVTLAAV